MKPLSWSELDLYTRDKEGWYQKYIAGIAEKPSPSMKLGSLIHKYIQTEQFPSEELTVGEIRIFASMLVGLNKMLELNGMEKKDIAWEYKATETIDGIPTLGFWDGYCEKKNLIIEIKTGKANWGQKRANEHGQLAFYALQNGKEPNFILFSASTSSGKCKSFHVKHSKEELEAMRLMINQTWKDMAPYHETRIKTILEV
jgi:hypothetical protein